ncbi:hypothetical protein K227x_39000 [Rubripirellula lacrimiformis]|uniref:Uncharacterized protein n=1 Tax=Rubripirellula lacrimiformis TaxID=1930273 RepID=A0A517NEF2_9BACT|nr:hypothetical protein [Rubripirellula lacrimiformis]QDT05500.1 hypothetical protein K227x_39000 [Rubripirellula lacrimiformis]
MRISLSIVLVFLAAMPSVAGDLLPSKPPAPWKPVDRQQVDHLNQGANCEAWMNSENGDVLIASLHPGVEDENTGALESVTEAAKSSLLEWLSAEDQDVKCVELGSRNSSLPRGRTKNARTGSVGQDMTKQPVVLATFVVEAKSGNRMANSVSFTRDGQTHLIQHVSKRPITNTLPMHLAHWAMRPSK